MKKWIFGIAALALLGIVGVATFFLLPSPPGKDPAYLDVVDVRVLLKSKDPLISLDLSYDCRFLLVGTTKDNQHTTLIVDTSNGMIQGSVLGVASARWAPDAKRFVAAGTSSLDVGGVSVYDTMGKRLGMIDKQGYAPVWSPDGGSIAYLRGKWGIGVAMLIASVDGGSPRQITENPLLSAPLRWIVPEKILYPVGETMFEWYAWDLKQNNRRALTLGAGARSAMLSPDGSQIVYEREGAEIWVNDLNRERQYRLTVGHDPIWILDGKRILYSVAERSNTLLTTFWTVNPGGSQPRAVQPREGVLATAYQWCPNMTSFVFASVKDRQDFVAIAILR